MIVQWFDDDGYDVQAVLSVFIDTTFLFGMSILEGKGPTASLENLKDKYDADDHYLCRLNVDFGATQ